MDLGEMPFVLLVNPSSAHGHALKLLPAIEAELDSRRIAFRVARTRRFLEDGVEPGPARGGSGRGPGCRQTATG